MSVFFCKLAPLVALNTHNVLIVLLATEDTIDNALEAFAIHYVDAGIPSTSTLSRATNILLRLSSSVCEFLFSHTSFTV